MYNHVGINIFDNISNVYMLSMATVFLAVIIAFYFANFLKDNGQTTKLIDADDEEGEQAQFHSSAEDSEFDSERENLDYLENSNEKAEMEEERRIEREQLAAIFELLKKQEAELNIKEIDMHELNAQLKLYR